MTVNLKSFEDEELGNSDNSNDYRGGTYPKNRQAMLTMMVQASETESYRPTTPRVVRTLAGRTGDTSLEFKTRNPVVERKTTLTFTEPVDTPSLLTDRLSNYATELVSGCCTTEDMTGVDTC